MGMLQDMQNGAQVPSQNAGSQAIVDASQQGMGQEDLGRQEEPATPEEEAHYEMALNVTAKIIYGEKDKTSNTIADSIVKENKPGSLMQTGLMLLKKVDDAIDLDPIVVPQLIEDTVKMLTDVAMNKNGIEFTDQEVKAAQMGMFEGVMAAIGGDEDMSQDFSEITQSMSPQELEQMKQEYQSTLGSVKAEQESIDTQVQPQVNSVQAGG